MSYGNTRVNTPERIARLSQVEDIQRAIMDDMRRKDTTIVGVTVLNFIALSSEVEADTLRKRVAELDRDRTHEG
jgi:hypothetical protein